MNRKYIISLALTAIFFVVAQIFIQKEIHITKNTLGFENRLEKQKMLSEKIYLLSHRIYMAKNKEEQKAFSEELSKTKSSFIKMEEETNMSDKHFYFKDESELKEYISESNSLSEKIVEKTILVEQLANSGEINKENLNLQQEELKVLEKSYNKNLENLLLKFNEDTSSQLELLSKIEIGVLILTFLVLLVEWRVVFKKEKLKEKLKENKQV